MKEKLKTIFYSDEINDDFAGTDIKTKKTPDNYKYIHSNVLYKFFAFIVYWIIAKPLVWIYSKISIHLSIKNRKILKKFKKQGVFVYANHVLLPEDAFIPNLLTNSKKNHIIVGYDAVSIKGLRTLVSMLGAYPIPSNIKNGKAYLEGIKLLTRSNSMITIYPEAHIWPYYTEIRPFKDVSFNYPYMTGAPVFSLTNTFVKSRNKLRKKPKVVSYLNGPFYADTSLPKAEAIKKLRDEVYQSMVDASKFKKQIKYKYDYIKQ